MKPPPKLAGIALETETSFNIRALSAADLTHAEALLPALNQLLATLSSAATPPHLNTQTLTQLLNTPTTTLFVAERAGQPVGMATLICLHCPGGSKGQLEDVAVLPASQGKGMGKALVLAALTAAKAQGLKKVDLTSNPSRAAANALYQRLGFAQRETNIYRHTLTQLP